MTTYYVRKDGSDSNNGLADTAGGAFLTIQKALNTVTSGTSHDVYVRAGTYYERLTVATSGTALARIVFHGEVDISGNPLTIVDGSSALVGAWSAADEAELLGTGAYKISDATITGMGALWEATNLQLIHQIDPGSMNGTLTDASFPPQKTGFNMLAHSASFTHPYSGVNVWDGIEALWGYRSANGFAYIRYRNGTNPNTRNLRWSPGPLPSTSLGVPTTAALHFPGKSYYTWNNFVFQGAYAGVFFDGTSAECTSNIINGGIIRGCHFRVYHYGRANVNSVRGTTLRSRLIGLVATPVGGAGTEAIASHAYLIDKFWWGLTTERDCGLKIRDSATHKPTGAELTNCDVFEGSQGISCGGDGGGDGMFVQNNVIHNHASQGIYLQPESGSIGSPQNWDIGHNIIYYSGTQALRTNALSNSMGTCYFHDNIISELDGDGKHLALYKSSGGGGNQAANFASTIWFTHNTFHGSNISLEFAGVNSGTGAPNWRFVNNIFALETPATRTIAGGDYAFDFEQTQARIGAYAQNAHRGSFSYFAPPSFPGWADAGNIYLTGPPWATSAVLTSETLATLPVGHVCRNAGLDLSQPFTIRGTNYPALSPYSSGYFTGVAPHMGAVQDAAVGDPTISASPTLVAQNATVTVTWTDSTTTTDWIALAVGGSPQNQFMDFKYTSSCTYIPGASVVEDGSCDFTMNVPAGVYEFRFFFNDGFTLLETSNQVTVTVPGAGSLIGTGDIIIF